MMNLAFDVTAPLRGREFTQEHRAKISDSRAGKPVSDAQLESLRGRKFSDEAREKMSFAQQKRRDEEDFDWDSFWSEERRKKHSEALTGRRYKLKKKRKPRVVTPEQRKKQSEAMKKWHASKR